MEPTQPRNYNISDLYEWHREKSLLLQPKFQRRDVWSKSARSYLIDTILRKLPVPKILIRQRIDLKRRTSIREVVDGQQRLRAVLDFIEGQLTVFEHHNPKYCNTKFEDLPDDVKRDFLAYQFSVDVLLGASDRDVLDIFTRINTYTMVLNSQEKLNAKFSGAFKQTVYGLGLDHLEFWKNNKVLTDRAVTRMAEAELASELVVAMLDGLQDGKKSLVQFYEKFEDEFPKADRVSKEFRAIIDLIADVFGDNLARTPFSRAPLFYSLFCAFYDCRYGLPKTEMGKVPITEKTKTAILQALEKLGNKITAKDPEQKYVELHTASRRSTDKLNERKIRHKFIWEAIHSAAERASKGEIF